MKKNRKKKAFTLTELLVVVIVIGVLSAVVLPKFSKVIETRKTTEAEEMMASVRTEQEKRCALDKNYTTDAKLVNLASLNTKNFNYTLKNTGIEAASTGKYGYTLKMPSYRDGRLCCDSAEQCAKLNKNYPLCSELTAKADYTSGTECAANDEPDNTPKSCSGSSTQACGCKNGGTQTRTCDTTTGTWSAWSTCSISDTCSCTGTKPSTTQTCNSCGTQTRTITCNTATGEWVPGNWGTCSKTQRECDCQNPPAGEASSRACPDGSTGTQTRTWNATACAWSDWTGTCTSTCDMTSDDILFRAQSCEAGAHNPNWKAGTWSTTTCSCTCPAGTTMDEEGACIAASACDDANYKSAHKSECCPSAAKTDTVCWKTEWQIESSVEEYWLANTGPHGDRTCEPEYTNAPRTDDNCYGSCNVGDTCTQLANYSFWNVGDIDCVGMLDTYSCEFTKNGW